MSHQTMSLVSKAKIAVAFYTAVAAVVGVGLARAEGLGPGLIFGGLPLLALGYSLCGKSFATWPWRAASNTHRALWIAVVICELLGLTLLLAGTVA